MYLSVVVLIASNGELLETITESLDIIISLAIADNAQLKGFAMVMTFIALLFNLFAKLLKVTACISLGQLSANHKLLFSVLYYFGIYVVQKIFTGIYFVFVIALARNDSYEMEFYGWESMLVSGIIYSVVFYLITWYVMDKKLNLE